MFTILDYSSTLEYSIIRRYTNIVYYYYKTVLVWCRYEIFVDGMKNQSFQDFRGWAERRDRPI